MPHPDEVTFARRGFSATQPATQQLEQTGSIFLRGMGLALESNRPSEFTSVLDDIDRQFRGFAYEGAAMGVAIAAAMTPWPRRQGAAGRRCRGESQVHAPGRLIRAATVRS